MSNFVVVVTSQAKMALRKAPSNERLLFAMALKEIAKNPLEERTEITFLSKRGKYAAYRYRTTVGMVLYLVDGVKKEVIITDVQPFKH
jgi:mRNA-degrading endonuclease RelE of RelBE toxin-antitoxin system